MGSRQGESWLRPRKEQKMTENEKYQDVLAMARAKHLHHLAISFDGLTPTNRINILKVSFIDAVSHEDEEGAVSCLELLKKALEDKHMDPLLEASEDKETLPPKEDENRTRGELAARKSQAKVFMALYQKLPVSRFEQRARPGKDEFPVFLKTKQWLVDEVCLLWKTCDTESAEKIFQFLVNDVALRFEEKKILLGAIQKATDSTFPPKRLARDFSQLGLTDGIYHGDDSWEILSRMAQGLARCTDYSVLALLLDIGLPMLDLEVIPHMKGELEPLRQHLKKVVAEAMELHEKASGLLKIIKKINSATYGAKVSYQLLEPNGIFVTVKITLAYGSYFDDERGHEWYSQIKKVIDEWRKGQQLFVDFKILVVKEYEDDKILFERPSG